MKSLKEELKESTELWLNMQSEHYKSGTANKLKIMNLNKKQLRDLLYEQLCLVQELECLVNKDLIK